MKIITNNHYRNIIGFYDIPEGERLQFEDYGEEQHFIKYKGDYLLLSDFIRLDIDSSAVSFWDDLSYWDGVNSYSYFAGWLIKIHPEGDKAIIARFIK